MTELPEYIQFDDITLKKFGKKQWNLRKALIEENIKEEFQDGDSYIEEGNPFGFPIGEYERSYPDAIKRTTEGAFWIEFVDSKYNDYKSLKIGCHEQNHLGKYMEIVRGDSYKEIVEKVEVINFERMVFIMKNLYKKNDFIKPSQSQKSKEMLMMQSIRGLKKANCSECGLEVEAEPDATSTYCSNCDQSVSIPALV